jgi:hypothetical protein
MSLEQQIANLVTASNNLTAEVAGKQAEIHATVAAQIAAMEAWKQGAKGQWVSTELKTIFVPGDADKWYPVCFPSAPNFGFLKLQRYIHEDAALGNFNGGLNVQFHATKTGYGGRPPAPFFDFYFYNGNLFNSVTPPIGKVALTMNSDNVVIWLLGNRHYNYALPNANENAYLPSAALNDPSNRLGDGSVPGVMTAVDAGSTKPNNYVRGGV